MNATLAEWVAASVAVHTFVAASTWLAGWWLRTRYFARRPGALQSALGWITRVAYFLGVPYAALIGGVATPAQFALGAAALATVIELLPALAGVFMAGAVLIAAHARLLSPHYPPHVRPAVRGRAHLVQPLGISFLLLDTLCLQAHWTFYRAGSALALPHLGVWGGAAIVLGEWLLDPRWLGGWRVPGVLEDQALLLTLMLFTTAIAAQGAGFWLTLAAHSVLWIGWLALLHLLHRG